MSENRQFLTGDAFRSIEEAQTAMREPNTTIALEEGERQLVLLALAKLSIERPGFLPAIEEIGLKMDNQVAGKPDTLTRLRKIHRESPVPHPLVSTDPCRPDPLMVALAESVKLQAHYAELLNAYDGGKRRQFASAREWIERLVETGKIATR